VSAQVSVSDLKPAPALAIDLPPNNGQRSVIDNALGKSRVTMGHIRSPRLLRVRPLPSQRDNCEPPSALVRRLAG
jgi:hypothetical protein